MPFIPRYEGEVATLGWEIIEWMEENLAMPDQIEYIPFRLTKEQAQFILNWYSVDHLGRWRYVRGVYSRPKGSGKSPFTGAIGIAQALGPVEFCGWDENGRPVGGPPKRPPLIQFAAVNEDQTENAYGPLLEMIKLGPLMENYPGVDPMDSFVALPNGGKIVPITANALSKEGAKSKLVVMDQTESWFKSNGGHKLANVLRRNSAKVGGRTLELPNAPESGMGSVAELTAKYAADIAAGKLDDKSPLLFDHREAPADFDLYDLDELRKSLVYVYGDSAMDNGGWVDIDRIVIEFLDPMNSVEELRRFYLNQAAQSADAWLSPNEVKAIVAEDIPLQDGDKIVLGFDGSQGRVKGKADATALIAIRLRDMSMHEIKIWEAPDDMRLAQRWAIDAEDVHDKVLETFETYDVVGFYADPSGWTEWITKWDAKFGKKLKLKATPKSAISAWPSGKTSQVITWVERLRQAIASSEVRLEHKSRILKQHIINARRRNVRNGYLLYKSYPMSPDKVDGAYAAMLAYKAAIEARSKNLDVVVERKKQKMTIYR